MLTNELLEAKYRAQRALAEQSGDDLHAYAENAQRIVRDIERKHGLKFRYRRSKTAAPALAKQTQSSERGPQA
jgi:hypothetical protein